MPTINTHCCPIASHRRIATCLAVLAGVLGLLGANAQARSDETPPAALALAAYEKVTGWVRSLGVPGAPEKLPIAEGSTPVTGVSIILRADGQVIGRGVEIDFPGSEARTADVLVWRAAQLAVAEVRQRLPRADDLLSEDGRVGLAARICVSIELAGPLTPITPATFEDTLPGGKLALNPGLDGVAARRRFTEADNRASVAIFPASMILGCTFPRDALGSVLGAALADPAKALEQPRALREQFPDLTMYRFRTMHAIQTSLGAPVRLLYRGDEIVPIALLTHDRIAGAIGQAGARLCGTLEPGLSAKQEATEIETPLVRFALAELASIEPPGQTDARLILKASRPPIPPTTGVQRWVIGAANTCGIGANKPSREACAEQAALLAECFAPATGFHADLPVPARGLVACALVRLAAYERQLGGPLRSDAIPLADSAVRRAFRDTPENELIAQMPWLGWAELELLDLKIDAAGDEAGAPKPRTDIPSAVALRRMREQVWQHQITDLESRGTAGDPDLVGGIIFAAGTPVPTWQSARPLAFIATMLADPRLTEPGEFDRELVRLLTGVRFLMQLQVGEASEWMYPLAATARGGVRTSPFDSRQPLDATSFTVITLVETLKALDRHAATASDARRGKNP